MSATQRNQTKVSSTNGPMRKVEVLCEAPEASEVYMAGEFNNWCRNSLPMHRNGDGIWRATVKLGPGEHQYRFIVDGNWQDDPKAHAFVPNVFGSQNSVLKVD